MGWRTTLRAGVLIAATVGVTLAVVTFAPTPRSPVSSAVRIISIFPEVAGALTPDAAALTPKANAADSNTEANIATFITEEERPVPVPSGMKSRLLIWQGAGRLVLHRPWFEFEESPLPLSLHLLGYGPEFFQYLFPLERPSGLTNPERLDFLRFGRDAHNDIVHRTVELGMFGLVKYLFLLEALVATAARLAMGRIVTSIPSEKLVMAALLAGLGGRTIEQMAGIPHISDVALFWTLLAVVVALPKLSDSGVRLNDELGQQEVISVSRRRSDLSLAELS